MSTEEKVAGIGFLVFMGILLALAYAHDKAQGLY